MQVYVQKINYVYTDSSGSQSVPNLQLQPFKYTQRKLTAYYICTY